MSDTEPPGGTVVAVLLTDGWHPIVPGSFTVGPLGYGAGPDPGAPGFRFQEADAGRPYQPTTLAGPLDALLAVRQVTSRRPLQHQGAMGQAWSPNGHAMALAGAE